MSVFRTLYHGEQKIDFPAMWTKALLVSLALVLISIGSLFVRGLNLGIEFEGGTSWEVVAPDAGVSDARDAIRGTDAEAAKIQTVGNDTIRVRSDLDEAPAIEEVTEALADLAGGDRNDVSVTTVGPSWGDEITGKAVTALIWFFVIVAVYIAIRLEWKMAIGALVAVAHDIVISVGVYSLFQFEVTPATVIAFLTIMGYSLYDTIVVFDKTHEVAGRLAGTGRYTYTEMMNLSLNQVLMRSINTSITSALPVLSMLVVGSSILGALTLQEFAIALLIGIIVGTYSSLFVASALVAWMKEREAEHLTTARKVAARGLADGGTRTVTEADAVLGTVSPTPRRPTADGGPRAGAAPPRPRKKKKKKR